MSARRSFWVAHAATRLVGAGLQMAGVYATVVTFGALLTVALYVAGGLAVLVQHRMIGRIQP